MTIRLHGLEILQLDPDVDGLGLEQGAISRGMCKTALTRFFTSLTSEIALLILAFLERMSSCTSEIGLHPRIERRPHSAQG